jgi:integrase
VALLVEHRAEQDRERDVAAQLWRESGHVFTTPLGEPINPNTDYHHWKHLLADAGLRDGRLHDARHTAATVLIILGVPERAVMGLMGWSTTAMTEHITGAVRAMWPSAWVGCSGAPRLANETATETGW